MNRRYLLVTWFISVSLLVAGMSCNPVAVLLDSATTDSEPQSGKWSGSLSYPASGGQDVTWILSFTVTEDRKQLIEATVIRYEGEPTPDTRATWMRGVQPIEIEDNSFSFSFIEPTGYGMPHTHEFEGTFVSSSKATGTLTTGGETHEWTVTPVEP